MSERRADYQDLRKIFKEELNGKLDRIEKKIDSHIEEDKDWKNDLNEWQKEVNSKLDKLKPVADSLITIQNLKKFVNWLGVSILVAVAWVWYKLK